MTNNVHLDEIQQRLMIDPELQDHELTGIRTILEFLISHPERLSGQAWGNQKPNLKQPDDQLRIAERYIKDRRTPVVPSKPKTVPDPATSLVLEHFFNYKFNDLDRMKIEHQHSMSAENAVGGLLEEYIDSVSGQYGWVQCCGRLVKSIDFIKKDVNGWIQLQVKNRDNTENSSSAAVRDGTNIQVWKRTKSRTGETNWELFPDENLRSILSEDGFREFVVSKMSLARQLESPLLK